MKYNKGFTLVELLAVMALLSVIALIVYPSIEDYVGGSKTKSYDVQIENIKASANNWAADNSKRLPNAGGETVITLADLKNGNYIDDVVNPKTKENFPLTTEITIKNDDGSFEYYVNVK